MSLSRGRLGAALAVCCAATAAACLVAAPAQAATNVYPAGGGTFSGGAQGWQVTSASCNVAAGCTAEGGYDGSDGNPPGSFAANTTIALNVLTLFKSTVAVQSPDFTVGSGGNGTLHLDRQFVSGSLVNLAPQATYSVTLLDRTAGTRSEPLTETMKEASPGFVGKDAAVTVKAGHTYAISIATETSSTVVGASPTGTTSVRFDNVALTVQANGGSGGGEGNGGGSLSNQQLSSLMQASLVGRAALKGRRLFVKARCPAKVGRACRISLQGLLKRGKPATSRRTFKVAKGKAKRVALRVKPKAGKKLAKRKRLLFKEAVKAGSAKATVYRRLKLIRRR
jgi:hypothetical protein